MFQGGFTSSEVQILIAADSTPSSSSPGWAPLSAIYPEVKEEAIFKVVIKSYENRMNLNINNQPQSHFIGLILPEVKELIFGYLDPTKVYNSSLICRHMRIVVAGFYKRNYRNHGYISVVTGDEKVFWISPDILHLMPTLDALVKAQTQPSGTDAQPHASSDTDA
ncbi:UNVERIFIED_CONTAM: hypothetical protein HDU68_002798 [Siphonaria sp. JEL0065]|nr:hypothetical protein HDU68_002798 [Siphonaria sp. JEL0065]